MINYLDLEIISIIQCTKEAEYNKRKKPKYGSILTLVKDNTKKYLLEISFLTNYPPNKIWHSCKNLKIKVIDDLTYQSPKERDRTRFLKGSEYPVKKVLLNNVEII